MRTTFLNTIFWCTALASTIVLCGIESVVDTNDDPENGPQAVIKELYKGVSSEPGSTPDWDKIREIFIKEAVIVLRTSREDTTVFTLEGFITDFVTFIERANVKERGFTERIVNMHEIVFGDTAHVLVLYEASLGDSTRPPQRGVDGISLIRKNDKWRIISITNERPTPDRPIPDVLKSEKKSETDGKQQS